LHATYPTHYGLIHITVTALWTKKCTIGGAECCNFLGFSILQ